MFKKRVVLSCIAFNWYKQDPRNSPSQIPISIPDTSHSRTLSPLQNRSTKLKGGT